MDLPIIIYFQKNKRILLLLFLWLFRLCFLTQGNRGGVAINKYVIIQIITIMLLTLELYRSRFFPLILWKYNATKHFAFLYIFGMISILWSVFPLMSFYFAFENLICMTALMYLFLKCEDSYQLEKLFIYVIIIIISMFLVKNLLHFRTFHSVSYSSIAAMLTMYCLPELYFRYHQPRNMNILKTGLAFGIIILIITTSGGAIFSTFLSLLTFLFLTQKKSLRICLILGACAIGLLLVFGHQQEMLAVLFPNKSTQSIMTAHGRTVVWEMINDKVAMKPLLGWGYAAVERILPIYCIDAHNSIVGIRGSLGNIGCIYLIFSMFYILLYLFLKRKTFGYNGIFFAVICAFINSNTYNFLGAKAGPCPLTFQSLLVLGAAYYILNRRSEFQPTDTSMDVISIK